MACEEGPVYTVVCRGGGFVLFNWHLHVYRVICKRWRVCTVFYIVVVCSGGGSVLFNCHVFNNGPEWGYARGGGLNWLPI